MIKYINELKKSDLDGKKVLLRVDFNVPIENKKIVEPFRVKAVKETIDYLLENGAKIMLVSHISAADNFIGIVEEVGEIIGQTITLVPLSERRIAQQFFDKCPVLLLDNIRQDKSEEENSTKLAVRLASGFDYYVNDAFSVSHRKHTSVAAITKQLLSYGGLLLKKEIENLNRALNAPLAGKTIILGGAKISTKLPVIKNFIGKAENILVGGALANNFFKMAGYNVGSSIIDESVPIDIDPKKLIIPEDVIISTDKTGKSGLSAEPVRNLKPEELILDVGPGSAKKFAAIIENSDMIIWNGPLGYFEFDAFSAGTKMIAEAVAKSRYSIIGGGDTISAVDKLGLLNKYSFVSTGGGAMLEFLAGDKLPGLAALGYYE